MSASLEIRLHALMPASSANGPGLRAVVWTQGCSLHCPGCFNPATHSPTGGTIWKLDRLISALSDLAPSVEGYTISGGEPLEQFLPVTRLVLALKQQTKRSIILLTGLNWAEIIRLENYNDLVSSLDVIICGHFKNKQRIARHMMGSANKELHFLTGRYTHQDFLEVADAEVVVEPNGNVLLSGINPFHW